MQQSLLSTITMGIFVLLILSGLVLLKELFLGNKRQLNSQTRKLLEIFNELPKDRKIEVENFAKKMLKESKKDKKSFFSFFRKKPNKILIDPISDPEILEFSKRIKKIKADENFEDLAKA